MHDVTGPMHANAALEAIVRKSHGRLLALLASASRDISAAEDALAHSYRSAAEAWGPGGVPMNPEGWLVRVAKNFMLDVRRSHFHSRAVDDETAMELPEVTEEEVAPDRRLDLMFAAAHPSLDESIRAPLILQTIVGLEVKEIAPLFSTPVATMAQRLVRKVCTKSGAAYVLGHD
jgi:RNA polymerase sigma-70 factor (ECF subfamily)